MAKYTYPSAKVKVINERLRKLEKVYVDPLSGLPMAESSAFYQRAKMMAIEKPTEEGMNYNVTFKNGEVRVRFITKTQFENMNPELQKSFIKTVEGSLNAPTSTKSGFISVQNKALQNLQDLYAGFEKVPEEATDDIRARIEATNKRRAYELKEGMAKFFEDQKDHFQYNKETWDLMSSNFDFYEYFAANRNDPHIKDWEAIFLKSWEYAANDNWEKIPKKYRVHN